MTSHTPMEKLEVYKRFEAVADWAWKAVNKFKPFHLRAYGDQFVRAADSICANLLEGDAREGKADSLRFFIIARGSAVEFTFWIRRARLTGMISEEDANWARSEVDAGLRMLNRLIDYRRSATTVRETPARYEVEHDGEAPGT